MGKSIIIDFLCRDLHNNDYLCGQVPWRGFNPLEWNGTNWGEAGGVMSRRLTPKFHFANDKRERKNT